MSTATIGAEFPVFRASLRQIAELTDKSSTATTHLTTIVEADPALAFNILLKVNEQLTHSGRDKAGDLPRAEHLKQETEKLFKSSGALWQASNAGTSGFGDTFMPWQAIAPTAWYIFLSLQDNVLEPLP